MPFVSDPNLDDSQQNSGGSSSTPPAGQVSGQPQAVSGSTSSQPKTSNSATDAPAAPSLASGSGLTSQGAGSGGKGGSSSSQPSYNPSTPTSSGQWTNLQNYLNTNNGGQFGQDFSGRVSNDVNQAQSAVTKASNDFQGAVDSGTVKNSQGILDQVGTAPDKMSADDQAAFQKQLKGSYTGPTDAGGDPTFQGSLQRAGSQAKSAYEESQAAETPGGQQALLTKFYNTPNYTPGGQALDSAILSSDPNAQAAIQSLAKQASGLPVSYQNASTAANNAAAGGAATSAASQQAAIDALYGSGGNAAQIKGGAFGNIEDAVNKNVSSYNDNANSEWAVLQSHLANGTATQADLDLLSGIVTPLAADGPQHTDQYNGPPLQLVGAGGAPAAPATPPTPLEAVPGLTDRNYGVGLRDYIHQAQAATTDSAATPEQAAQLAALSQLAGQPNTFLKDPTQAGSYDPRLGVTFDNAAYKAGVAQAQGSYESQKSALDQWLAHDQEWQKGSATSQNGYTGTVRGLDDIAQHNQQRPADIAQLAALEKQYGKTVGGDPYNPNAGSVGGGPILAPPPAAPPPLAHAPVPSPNGGTPPTVIAPPPPNNRYKAVRR